MVRQGRIPLLRRRGGAFCAALMFSALAAALFLTCIPSGVRTAGSFEHPPILLGLNYPLTGPYSVEGLDQVRAARMAVDEVNASGGVLGRRFELVTRDSASDVLLTRINVEELVEKGCRMVFGGSSSAVAVVASKVCLRHNIPFFGTLTYSTATTLEFGNRMTFRECNDAWMSAKVMADWLNVHFGGKRFFFITADYTWGWTTEKSIRQVTGALDAKAHPGLLRPLGATDFRDALQQAAAFKPDVLVLVLFGKDMAYALRQAYAMGLNKTCQIVVPNLTLGMAERTGAEAMEGVVGALPWTWKLPYLYDFTKGKAFVEEFVRRYRRYPSTSAASAYSIVLQYKSAVERAGSFATAPVVRALEGHSYSLLKGGQTWRALDHQNVQDVYMVRGRPPKEVLADPLRLDLFEIINGMEGEDAVRSEEDWKRLRRELGLPPRLEPLEEQP